MALDLVELETNPSQSERVDRMFRTIHTIKGTCGFLDFEKLAEISHQGEVLLSAIRKGQSPIGRDTIDALLRLHDTILDILSVIETHASDVAYKMSVDLGEQLVTLAQDTPPATKTERTPTVDGPRPTPPALLPPLARQPNAWETSCLRWDWSISTPWFPHSS